MANKIDSNLTGLRYCREVAGTPGVLTGTDIWKETEPNSYEDFGSTITTTPRAPINASRQRKKGRVTDKESNGGFQLDFTSDNMLDFMPGFFFADWRKAAAVEVVQPGIVATSTTYTKTAAFAAFDVGTLVLASGFGIAGNNGLKTVTVTASGAITVAGLTAEAAPPATAQLKIVGFECTAAQVSVDVSNPLAPRLVFATGNPLTLTDLIPGQWIYIGGDTAASRFALAGNNGICRVSAISATAITLDKTQNTMVTDAGTGKTIQLFFGDVLKNESDPTLIKQYSFQFERKLGADGYQYLVGAFPNELAINIPNSDKIVMDLGFIALDSQVVLPGARKAGTFPAATTDAEAFNTSSDFTRIRAGGKAISAAPLFGYIQEMTLNINNNITPLKALGVLGAFDVSVGDFEVSGDITAYFNDIAAVDAVNNSTSLTVDFLLAFNNRGWVFDIPLFTGNGGLLNVEKDNPITIPLGVDAAEDPTLRTTFQANYFPYLPNAAQ